MGKYFDRLCRIAEKNNANQLISLLEDAKLFVFSGNPVEFVPKLLDQNNSREQIENFFLPFQTIAVEDDRGIVLMHASDTDDHAKNIIVYDLVEYGKNDDLYGFAQLKSLLVVSLGYSGNPDIPINEFHDDQGQVVLCGKDDSAVRVLGWNDLELTENQKMGNFITALCEVLILNTPARFVFEIAPVKTRNNPKKILRTHERSTFTLLTPGEIKKRYGLGVTNGGMRGTKTPHPRRRHQRTLYSEKFKNKQGQTIVIPACWVGPEEKQIGNKVYRVRLDV